MYGHREPLLLSIDAREFSRKFQQISESTIIHLATGEATYDVLVKDFQANHIVERLEHIDFFEIERGKVLRARVLLHYVGNPVGVREGGLQELLVHEIEVECLPRHLPERLNVDIENLGVGQSLPRGRHRRAGGSPRHYFTRAGSCLDRPQGRRGR